VNEEKAECQGGRAKTIPGEDQTKPRDIYSELICDDSTSERILDVSLRVGKLMVQRITVIKL